MIGCGFFDDEQPTDTQNDCPRWASISDISTFLDVSRNTISTAVKRAWANREPWVKKKKAEDGNTLYLIDTQHDLYLSHQERWKQNKALRTAFLGEAATDWSQADHVCFHPQSSEAAFPPHAPLPLTRYEHHSEGVLQRWPRFREWLYSHGIQVFQNLLAEERQKNPWEWRWGELHGEGFASDEAAIIAVLQSRFDADETEIADLQRHFDTHEAEREEQEDTTFFRMREQQDLQKPQFRRFWFGRND